MFFEPGLQCFKKSDQLGTRQGADEKSKEENRRSGEGGPKLLCKLCRALVTTRGDAIEVEGKHQHTFFNPAGILFEIGCFARATGCLVSGQPTEEFSWFKGCRWQISRCSSCGAHLGWYFSGSSSGAFHGLITNRLVEADDKAS